MSNKYTPTNYFGNKIRRLKNVSAPVLDYQNR